MKAVIVKETGKADLVDIKEQSMRPDYVKVKTVAVAVNPTDFHHAAGAGLVGGILGCDVSGIVEEVGKDCKTEVKKGDAVYGVCHCANHNNAEDGAFAEFAMVKDGHLAKIPAGVSFEEAATLGVGVTTVGQTLYMTLKLPLPTEPAKTPITILIYGGSTATGTLAIQYAKLSGLTVVTTASPKSFDLVKSRGADVVFDYHDADCAEKIRAYTHNALHYVLDTISTESSFKICADALPKESTEELKLAALLPLTAWPRDDVNAQSVLAYTTFGEAFTKFGMDFPPIKEHFEFGEMFWKLNAKLLAEGKIKPHPVSVQAGGLQGVPAGIREMATGSVSGSKLVYRVAETTEDASAQPDTETVLRGPTLSNW
ncbi:MAG: hypothetical protein M1818_003605 [Claussenomyces sp. TS43310]|nr:MAG: hypothetical protein M1818_003605 [Claussenomyces sp. TS43310]